MNRSRRFLRVGLRPVFHSRSAGTSHSPRRRIYAIKVGGFKPTDRRDLTEVWTQGWLYDEIGHMDSRSSAKFFE
jgi:hypothetical protein